LASSNQEQRTAESDRHLYYWLTGYG